VIASWLITTIKIHKFAKTDVVMGKPQNLLSTPLIVKSFVMMETLKAEMDALLLAGSNLGTSALLKPLEESQSVFKNSK
jgi:hypothetical protein